MRRSKTRKQGTRRKIPNVEMLRQLLVAKSITHKKAELAVSTRSRRETTEPTTESLSKSRLWGIVLPMSGSGEFRRGVQRSLRTPRHRDVRSQRETLKAVCREKNNRNNAVKPPFVAVTTGGADSDRERSQI